MIDTVTIIKINLILIRVHVRSKAPNVDARSVLLRRIRAFSEWSQRAHHVLKSSLSGRAPRYSTKRLRAPGGVVGKSVSYPRGADEQYERHGPCGGAGRAG